MTILTLSIKLPCWWRLYIGSLLLMHNLGMLRINPEIAAAFVMRHTKFYVGGRRV